MNEAEWLVCTDPKPILEFLRGKASDRKLRLFAVACCRRISHLVVGSQLYPQNRQQSRTALEVAERFADGEATDEERQAAFNATFGKGVGPGSPIEGWEADYEATSAIGWSTVRDDFDAATKARRDAVAAAIHGAVTDPIHITETDEEVWTEPALAVYRAESALHCELLRDIFGNPFRSVKIKRTWLRWQDGAVVKMAQHIYDERYFDLLPTLCDALEEAGCSDEQLVKHGRLEKVHVRGCWLIDLLLGKE